MILLKTFKSKEKLICLQNEIEASGILTLVKTYDSSNVYKYHLFVQKEKYAQAYKKLQLFDFKSTSLRNKNKKISISNTLSNLFNFK